MRREFQLLVPYDRLLSFYTTGTTYKPGFLHIGTIDI